MRDYQYHVHLFFQMLQIVFFMSHVRTRPTLLLRTEDCYAVYPAFHPCPGSSLIIKFHEKISNGLLAYSEDSSSGRFLAVTILPNRKIKVEFELRLPQYRITAEHVIMMFDLISHEMSKSASNGKTIHWHMFNLSIESSTGNLNTINRLTVRLDDQSTSYNFNPGIYFNPYGSLKLQPSFGDLIFVGQVPKSLRLDATQRALFSAAMQPTLNGQVQVVVINSCEEGSFTFSDFFKRKITTPLKLEHGSLWHTYHLSNEYSQGMCQTNFTETENEIEHGVGEFVIPQNRMPQYTDEISKVINMNGSSKASFTLKLGHESEQIYFHFRTRIPDQMLFSTVLTIISDKAETNKIPVHVAIYFTNGSIRFSVENYHQIGATYSGPTLVPRPISCVSDYATCADAQWHQMKMSVFKTSLLFSLDRQPPHTYHLSHATARLSIQAVHLGFQHRSAETNLFGSSLTIPRQLFQGCFRNIMYKIDDQKVAMLASVKQTFVDTQYSKCDFSSKCNIDVLTLSGLQLSRTPHRQSNVDYVSFVQPGGYLRIPGWHVVLKGEVTFRLRTTELNGLLIYSSSVNHEDLVDYPERSLQSLPIPGGGKAGFDIFALELRDGYLFCVINTGSGPMLLGQFGSEKPHRNNIVFLSDGQTHEISIFFSEGNVAVKVDDRPYMAYTADEKTYKYLNLNGVFYIGGVPEVVRLVSSVISPEVWSTRLRWDYIGCLGDLRVDGKLWDLELELRACWVKTFVLPQCMIPSKSPLCLDGTCGHDGRCLTGWNRFVCDCSNTNFIGPTCSEEAIMAGFNGHQWISLFFSPFPIQSTVEELIIRFQTKQSVGLLFTTKSSFLAASDCLELRIVSGYLHLLYDFGEASQRYNSSIFVSDDAWHTVRIQRRERYLNFTVDDSSQVYNIPKDGRFLSHNEIILGREKRISEPNSLQLFPSKQCVLSPEQIKLSVFIGNVMSFWFNGFDVLNAAKHLHTESVYNIWQDKLEVTASEGRLSTNPMIEFPLSLETHESYIRMELLGAFSDFVLQFWLKADKNFGIILLMDAGISDLFGLELVNGNLNVVYSKQNSSTSIQSKQNGALVDSKWHRIQVIRTSSPKSSFEVHVDWEIIKADLHAQDISNKQVLLFGGVPQNKNETARYKSFFHSIYGFSGCVASIQINQTNRSSNKAQLVEMYQPQPSRTRITTLFSDEDQGTRTTWKNVEPGCKQNRNSLLHSTQGNCTPRVCQFDGRCVQQWGTTRCDCSMTSFTGDYCTKVAPAIHLSLNQSSILNFEMNPAQNTTRDHLAFGIQVVTPAPVILMLIQGQGESPDYLEVSIIKIEARHVLLVRYNMGAGQHTLYEPNVDVGDGQYHIVQFVRDGSNGLLRIDLEHERTTISKEKHGTHFNKAKHIHFGLPFKKLTASEDNATRTAKTTEFDGFITGAYFNYVNLFGVLQGLVIPGIFLSEKQNVRIEKHFAPKMKHLTGLRSRNDIQNQAAASDVKIHTNEQGANERDFYTGPLIIAKPDCVDPVGVYDSKTCSPYDLSGIVQPTVEFKKTTVTGGSFRSAEPGQDWNADQSKIKQTQPNDSGSNNPVHASNTYQEHPTVRSSEPSTWMKEFDISNPSVKFPDPELIQLIEPSNTRKHNDYEDTELGLNPRKQLALNIGLISSVSVGGICVLIALTCVIYRCMRRDEGSYNVDENLAYTGESSTLPSQTISRTNCQREERSKGNVDTQMNRIRNSKLQSPEMQSGTESHNSTLFVTFSDSCHDAVGGCGALGASSFIKPQLISAKQELLYSPSLQSTDGSTKRSRLLKIDTSGDRQIAGSLQKLKQPCKSVTDSQEWYV